MEKEIENHIQNYCSDIQDLFSKIREQIIKCAPEAVEEKLWAKLPSFYVEDKFVRLIPFKDHINIEASGLLNYKPQLKQFNMTQKGMLQIYLKEDLPIEVLFMVFQETFIAE